MSNTVKIYKTTCTKGYSIHEQGIGFTLEPWSGDTADYEGYSDDGTLYELPEGYEVSETAEGIPAIYKDTIYCDLTNECDSPVLVTHEGYTTLRKVGV